MTLLLAALWLPLAWTWHHVSTALYRAAQALTRAVEWGDRAMGRGHDWLLAMDEEGQA